MIVFKYEKPGISIKLELTKKDIEQIFYRLYILIDVAREATQSIIEILS